jgi:hypothetical protein
LALTERFDLVPAEFLVIPTDGHNVGGIGDSLGPPPSRSPRDDHRRSNEFDRGYHQQQQQQHQQQQQQQQRTRYDLDLTNFHHPNFSERNSSPPGPSSSSDTSLGHIGESPSPSSRTRIGRTRTGTMVFAEAEANTVTDELAARSSLREREQEPQKIALLERDREPMPLKTVIPATTANEEEDVEFELSLSPEIGEIAESGGGGGGEEGSSVASEVFEEGSGSMEKHEVPSLLDLKLESEAAVNTAEIAVLPSAPAEPEPEVFISHSSTEEKPAEPAVSSIEEKSDDSLETQPIIPTETTIDCLPADDNVSIPPEPALIPKETLETVVASQEDVTNADAVDDKETIPPLVIDDSSELPIFEESVDEMPTDKVQPKVDVDATVEVGEVVTEEERKT